MMSASFSSRPYSVQRSWKLCQEPKTRIRVDTKDAEGSAHRHAQRIVVPRNLRKELVSNDMHPELP